MRRTRGQAKLRQGFVLGPPAGWLVFFLLVPMGLVVLYGLGRTDETYIIRFLPPYWGNFADMFTPGTASWVVIPLLFKTFFVAAVQTLLSLVAGYAIAYYIARLAKESRRGILMSLIVIPFWVSFVVRVYGLFAFSTEQGFVQVWMRTNGLTFLADFLFAALQVGEFHMLVFTLMYVWIPFMILPLFTSLSKIDPQLLEAASDLGASRMRAFFRVTLPLSFPGVVTGSILTFITSVGSFVEPIMVGGTDWLLVGNFVVTQFESGGGVNLPSGAAASVLIMISTLLLISIYTRYAEAQETGEVRKARIPAWFRRLFVPVKALVPSRRPVPARLSRLPTAENPSGAREAVRLRPDGGNPVANGPIGGVPRGTVEKVFDRLVEKFGKGVLAAVTYIAIIGLFLPLIFVAVFSFNAAEDSFGSWRGFSLQWYLGGIPGSLERQGLLMDKEVMDALASSVIIGLGSAVIALVFGMLAAYGIVRYRFRFKEGLKSIMYLGLVVPSIVLGVSIAILITFLNDYILLPTGYAFIGAPLEWRPGMLSVLVGHATFNIPLATLILLISFREFDRSLEEAAMSLGADEITTFFRVTIPNIMPGIVSALLLTFTFSFDELPVTIFLTGEGFLTFPVAIWGLISKHWLTPEINAASTLVLALSVIFVIAANKVQKGGMIFRI